MRPGMLTRTMVGAVMLLFISISCTKGSDHENPEQGGGLEPSRDYTFGYWLNGWRKAPQDDSADILALASGYYGLRLNLASLDKPEMGGVAGAADYAAAVATTAERLENLEPAELEISVEIDGETYALQSCRAGRSKGLTRLTDVWLWESGRLAQVFDILELEFRNRRGESLSAEAKLQLVAWPKSLTWTLELTPSANYRDGDWEGVVGGGLCVMDKPFDIEHAAERDPEQFSIECWVNIPSRLASQNARHWLLNKNSNEWVDGFWGFLTWGGHLQATMNIGGGMENQHHIRAAKNAFRQNYWNHLVLTYDGQTMWFYLNGELQGEKTIGRVRRPGNSPLRIGQRQDGYGDTVKALFDQIRIWNRALELEQIKDHAATPASIGNRDGLVFEENFSDKAPLESLPPVWDDAAVKLAFRSELGSWATAREIIPGAWQSGDKRQFTLNCDIVDDDFTAASVSMTVATPQGQGFPVAFDVRRNCMVANVPKLNRNWKTGYTDIRDYDEFDLTIRNNTDTAMQVPFLLDFYDPANITGLVAVLCDPDGVPTGIPVQVSKNWHYAETGEYLRAYMLLPAIPDTSRYKLRIAYGFYGQLPSASHAQLSLVGYGGNGRWEQLAIGCWGETMCLDMDMSLVDVAITDNRGLMLRDGEDGTRWQWTDGGWGGDWLNVPDSHNGKLFFTGMRTAYLAHGPCLTDVRYGGWYGGNREVAVQAQVETLRTDDYARTFQTLRYQFNQTLPATDSWLCKMGRTGGYVTPKIAWGNRDGLLVEKEVPTGLKVNEPFVGKLTLSGPAPWWIAFPGAYSNHNRKWGTGSRALVIRSYTATIGGKTYSAPTISMPVFQVHPDGKANLDLLITPPEGVTAFAPGDTVEMSFTWIVVPRIAEDYYGPNELFRQHLVDNPRSWQTVYREAKGNDLHVSAQGGAVLRNYPILLKAEQPEVRFSITGGVGYVPVRFEGLADYRDYALYRIDGEREIKLDQSTHGNDYWQTDYDARSNTYRMSFNLPLDTFENSEWILKREIAD